MAKIICEKCGNKNAKGSVFCMKCGVALTEQLPSTDFSVSAQETVESSNDSVSSVSALQTTEQKKSHKLPVLITAAVVLLGGGFAAFKFVPWQKLLHKTADSGITLFHDGLVPYKDGDYYGYLDKNGNVAVNAQFNSASDFSEGFAVISVKNGDETTYGFIDKQGNYLVNPQFEKAFSFWDGTAIVQSGDYYGVIGADGKYIINPQYKDNLYYCGNGLFLVPQTGDSESGILVDITGKEVSPTKFSLSNSHLAICREKTFRKMIFGEDFSLVPMKTVNGKWGYIDNTGNLAIAPQYDAADSFNEGLAAIKINDKYGYINKKGETVINPQFDKAASFSNGLAAVGMNNEKKGAALYGYINQEGKYTINTQFSSAGEFKNGLAIVQKKTEADDDDILGVKTEYYVIQTDGTELDIPSYNYQDIASLDNTLFRFREDNKYGFFDQSGNTVIDCQYSGATSMYSDGYAIVVSENKQRTVVNRDGERIWDKEFDGIG